MMTNRVTSDSGQIAAAEAYFTQLIADLRKVVSDVREGRGVAGRALKAQGMARFQRAFDQWNEEINELERDLRNVGQKTQQTGQRMAHADQLTDQVAGQFSGINR